MKFFDRKSEIDELRRIRKEAYNQACLTVITGRRRTGKTTLVKEAYKDEDFLYFFVSRTVEQDLCDTFQAEMEDKLGLPVLGKVKRFAEIFEYLMKLSRDRSFTLFIDEFQDFERVNPSVFSEIQRIWDMYHTTSHINLVVCGSIYSLMTKIFQGRKEPLFNRQSYYIRVNPFTPPVLKEILGYYTPEYSAEDLLALYCFTGGVAKYVQLLVDSGAFTCDRMIERIINSSSVFLGEGKSALVEEFGKNYNVYFSIMSAIASGKTRRAEIEDVIGKEIGGYLTILERDFGMIRKRQPLFAKNTVSNVIYEMVDVFYMFWFRFVYKYSYMLEIGNYESLRAIIKRDYNVYSGRILERYFIASLAGSGEYTRIGGWWNRRGENEIDIISENELEKIATFYEVKRQRHRINLETLRSKANSFCRATGAFADYTLSCRGLSMEDM